MEQSALLRFSYDFLTNLYFLTMSTLYLRSNRLGLISINKLIHYKVSFKESLFPHNAVVHLTNIEVNFSTSSSTTIPSMPSNVHVTY